MQGVGFRYTVQNLALQYDVRGYVRNLPDGRVELVIERPDMEMDHLVDAIGERMSRYIERVDRHDLPATGEFQQFCIKHC